MCCVTERLDSLINNDMAYFFSLFVRNITDKSKSDVWGKQELLAVILRSGGGCYAMSSSWKKGAHAYSEMLPRRMLRKGG